MKYSLLLCMAIVLCNINVAQTSNTYHINNLKYIPDGFKYKDELKKIVFVPGNSFVSGEIIGADSLTLTRPARITIASFYMNSYEVSNGEYKQFVHYVRDSIAHFLLGDIDPATGRIDWKKKIDWKDPKLEPLMTNSSERIYGKAEIDVAKLIYKSGSSGTIAVYPDTLAWIRDFVYTYNEPLVKKYFSHPAFAGYPVVGVSQQQAKAYCSWKTEMWNNALAEVKFEGSVSIRLPYPFEWEYGALEFTETKAKTGWGNSTVFNKKDFSVFDRTQTNSYKNHMYDVSYQNKGYKYNFGRIIDANEFLVKDFIDDGNFYTAACNAFKPNDKGFYNLSGNVAEWTDAYGSYNSYTDEASQTDRLFENFKIRFPNSPLSSLTPQQVDAYLKEFKIVKGGSWYTIPFYLQPGANQYFSQSERHCYLGFRIAMDVQYTGKTK